MNVFALKGHKVRVTRSTAKAGYDSGQSVGELELDRDYTVERTEVGNMHTKVYLEEVPGKAFNSMNFEDVTEQSEEDDQKHPDWARYN